MSTPPEQRRSDAATRVIHASPDAIYRAFGSADALMLWLPPAGMTGRALEYDFQEDGRYRIELRYDEKRSTEAGKTTNRTDVTSGRFIELLPGRRITQSVEFESGDPAFAGDLTMTWSFDVAPEGTAVTVTANNVPDGSARQTMMPA